MPALFAGAALLSFGFTFSRAEGDMRPMSAQESPVLVELFTSQSCSSCPPAEAYFSELAKDDSLVVVEWHVDYWDDLVYGRDGAWKDPYSSRSNTIRQRSYARAINGDDRIYTPQAVVGGALETVGSNRGRIQKAISDAPSAKATISVDSLDDMVLATVEPRSEDADKVDAEVYFIRLVREQTTDVPRGENAGRTLSSRNVAVGIDKIGEWSGGTATYKVPALEPGQSCAIVVQDRGVRTVNEALAAAYCG